MEKYIPSKYLTQPISDLNKSNSDEIVGFEPSPVISSDPNSLEKHLNKSSMHLDIKQRCITVIGQLYGMKTDKLIEILNKEFTYNTINKEKISIRDALVKSNLYGILSQEQGELIYKYYKMLDCDEIHFGGVGSGHEVLSFEDMDIFGSEGCPKIVAFDNDSEELSIVVILSHIIIVLLIEISKIKYQ